MTQDNPILHQTNQYHTRQINITPDNSISHQRTQNHTRQTKITPDNSISQLCSTAVGLTSNEYHHN